MPPLGKGALYIRPLLLGSGPLLGLGPAPTYTFVVYAAAVGAYFKVEYECIALDRSIDCVHLPAAVMHTFGCLHLRRHLRRRLWRPLQGVRSPLPRRLSSDRAIRWLLGTACLETQGRILHLIRLSRRSRHLLQGEGAPP